MGVELEGGLEIKLPPDLKFDEPNDNEKRVEDYLRRLARALEDYSRGAYGDVEGMDSTVIRTDNTTAFTPDADYEPATKKYTDDLVAATIPTGVIILWSGAIVDIPDGWHLCDGTDGTIDLQDKFVVGAGNTYAVAATGGSTSHGHADTLACASHTHPAGSLVHAHTHSLPTAYWHTAGSNQWATIATVTGAASSSAVTGNTGATAPALTGSVTNTTTLPPYYALAFIQKV